MACSVLRPGLALVLAICVAAGGGVAGELFRPVPSDAQVTRFTRFNIRYTLRDVVADGVQKVEFYITEDMGRTWRLYGEDPDLISPMTIQVPGEGVYGFVCIATDRFGNREREPGPRTRPETVIVVDRTPPQAKWIAPLQDSLAKNGLTEFTWETSDPYLGATPVILQYALNAGSNHDRDAAWEIMQEKLPAAGTINWAPPEGASGKFNFRLLVEDRAGNITVAYNPTTLVIDNQHPRVVAVSPLKANKLDVDIMVEADDGPGGSGVRDITIYTSANNGILWDLLKETTENMESVPLLRPAGQPIPFKAPQPGDYAIWPVVFDMADNASPIPPRGIPGPYILSIDTEPPMVTLSNSFLQGRNAILANETRVVEWTSYDPHPREGTAIILLSLDNGQNWQEIRSGGSSTGSAVINFPFGSASEEAMLKVTVEDDFGNVGESTSQAFKLSAADTMITDVAPVGQADYYTPPTGSSSFGGDDFGTQPPSIPPPPQTSFPPGFPGATSDPYAIQQPTSQYPSTFGSDPFAAPYSTPTASDPYATTYSPPVAGDPYATTYTPPVASDPYATTYTPPVASDPYATTYTPPVASDPYATTYTSPVASDPYAAPYTPPVASDPYAALYGSQAATTAPYPSSVYVPGQDDSTAGSFPSAMIGGAPAASTSGPAAAFPATPAQPTESATTYTPPAIAAAPSAPAVIESWQPTPQQPAAPTAAATTPATPTPSAASPFGEMPAWTDTAPPSPPAIATTPPASPLDTTTAQTPSWSSATPATPADDDPFSSFSFDSGGTIPAPPALSDSGSTTPSLFDTPSTSTGAGGSPFDIFGSGSLTPPPLPGEAATPSAPTGSTQAATQPPALPSFDVAQGAPAATPTPADAATPPAFPSFSAPPAETASTPSTPAPGLFDTAPQEVAPIAGFDSAGMDDTLMPPPMSPAGALPSDPRQLSNHYAEETKNYLDEGRFDLALDAANRAVASDGGNALAHSRLAQVYVQQDPPDFARAATQAKEATNLGRDWYSWWTCADVFYRWAHARNRLVQTQIRSGQRPSPDILDERNQALNNAQISVGNAEKLVQGGSEADREQVAMTQGEIIYLRALSIPEPIRPPPNAPAATQDEYRRSLMTYKNSVTPILLEALPYFQTAMRLGGSPSYRETFHMGIINFRLGGLEKDTGNIQQAARYYESAAQFLEEATIATQVPAEGPREAYYMLAYCHDQLAEQPGRDRARQKEMALRYWRRTVEFYAPGSSYRDYAEQRVIALQHELGL